MARLSGIQRIMEVGMMLSCAFAFFLLLALASFHPADPSWSQAGLQGGIHNWVGPVGAWLADIMFFSFGWMAYFFPFAAAFLGWFMFQQRKLISEFDYLTIGLRIIGLILALLGAAGIFSISVNDLYYFNAGGFVGDVISAALIPYLNIVGATLFLLCFFCTGFTLLSGISWLSIVDKIGEFTIGAGRFLYGVPKQIQNSPLPLLGFKPFAEQTANTGTEPSDEIQITSMRAEPPAEQAVDNPSFNIPDEVLAEPVSKNPVSLSELRKKIVKGRKANDSQVDSTKPTEAMSDAPEEQSESISVVEGAQGPMPSFDLLERADKVLNPITPEELEIVSRLLEEKLAEYEAEENGEED